MKRGHHLCAFTNFSGNSFGRSRAYVADGEYAWQAGFELPVDASMSRYLVDRIAARPNIEVLTQSVVAALEYLAAAGIRDAGNTPSSARRSAEPGD